MRYGAIVSGRLDVITVSLEEDRYSKPGDIYQIELHTDRPFTPEDEANIITQSLTLEQQFPDLKVLYVETCNEGKITIQVQDVGPGAFSVGGLISWMPQIFILIGIALVAYTLWQVYQTNPLMMWALVVVGGAVAFYLIAGPALKGLPTATAIRTETKEKLKYEGQQSADVNLENWRKSVNSQRISSQTSIQEKTAELNKELKKPAKKQDTTAVAELQREIDEYSDELKKANASLEEIGRLEKELAQAKIEAYKKKS